MDILFSGKKNYIIAVFSALAACILMIVFSEMAVLSAKKGISLWLSNVLPAMLPFFICVNFLTYIGATRLIPTRIFPFVMSVLSGYPMGAKITGDLYRTGIIRKEEAKRLMSFCSTSNPVFLIGAVGIEMLGSQTAGVVVASAHYLAAVCNGILYSFFIKKEEKIAGTISAPVDYNVLEQLTNAILSSFKSLAVILAYIIMFMFLLDLLEYSGAFQWVTSEIGEAFLRGMFEMTVGCSWLASGTLTLNLKCAVAASIISWSGLSIIGQSMSMLSGTGISILYLAATKLTHSIFAGIIALFLGSLML